MAGCMYPHVFLLQGLQPEARLQQLLAPQIHTALAHLESQQGGPQPALLVVSLEDVSTRHSSSSSGNSQDMSSSSSGGGGATSPAAAAAPPPQSVQGAPGSSSSRASHGLSCAVYCKVVPPVPLSPSPVEVRGVTPPVCKSLCILPAISGAQLLSCNPPSCSRATR
jgi:hypothetical protein